MERVAQLLSAPSDNLKEIVSLDEKVSPMRLAPSPIPR